MTLTIIPPRKTVNGLDTTALAVESQALYQCTREDYLTEKILEDEDNDGFIAVFLNAALGDVAIQFDIDDFCYVFDGGGIYSGVGKIATTDWDGLNTLIGLDIPYTVDSINAGYLNDFTKRPSYNIQVEVRDAADTFTVFDEIYRYVTPQSGQMNIDLQAILSIYLKAVDIFSFQYFARITEDWEGSAEAPNNTGVMQAVLAFKQITTLGGALMWESLPRLFGTATDNSLGKILTKYETPKMWVGWNRTVAILIDAEYTTRVEALDFNLVQRETDVNKLPTAPVVLTPSAPTVNVQIFPLSVNTGFYNQVYFSDNGGQAITDTLYYQILGECAEPVMLDWINSSGGISQHLFTNNQIINIESGRGIQVETPINVDYEDVKRTKRRFRGPVIQRMTLTADNLTEDDLLALRELKDTESLRVYLSKDGVNFIDAVVSGDFITTYSTKHLGHSMTVTIEFPDNYNFEQAKLY